VVCDARRRRGVLLELRLCIRVWEGCRLIDSKSVCKSRLKLGHGSGDSARAAVAIVAEARVASK